MCVITATEFKKNLNKYMALSHNENVYVTKNGKIFTVLSNPFDNALKAIGDFHLCFPETKKAPSDDELIGEAVLEKGRRK